MSLSTVTKESTHNFVKNNSLEAGLQIEGAFTILAWNVESGCGPIVSGKI